MQQCMYYMKKESESSLSLSAQSLCCALSHRCQLTASSLPAHRTDAAVLRRRSRRATAAVHDPKVKVATGARGAAHAVERRNRRCACGRGCAVAVRRERP